MSLTQPNRTFAGHEQGDCAGLLADGEWYRCYTFLNRANWRIESVVTVEQEGGGESVVFHSAIDTATSNEIDQTAGIPLDSPKVMAIGETFVVHYLKATETPGDNRDWALYRSSMIMTAFDASVAGWTSHGAVGVYEPFAAYDAHPIIDSTTDFVVARITAQDEITVQRFVGTSWLDNDWDAFITWPTAGFEGRVCACWGADADNSVLVSYEPVGSEGNNLGGLWTTHLDADNGTNQLHVRTFPNANSGTFAGQQSSFAQVGHVRVGSDRVVVTAELQTSFSQGLGDPYRWMHHLAFRQIEASTADRVGAEHWTPNLNVCSRPWAYTNGTTANGTTPDVYVLVSYKSAYDTNDWEQAYMYVLNLDLALWDVNEANEPFSPRPILTVAGLEGIPDARVSGWHPENLVDLHAVGPTKRMNHITAVSGAPPSGPDVKTRTLAIGIFARLTTLGVAFEGDADATTYELSELQPENAGIRGLKVYMEDPWTIYRDAALPTQPVDNFKAPYPRTQCQTLEAGRALFISGGTPGSYDGRQVVESGFPWKPEILDITGQTTGGADALTPDTDYTYLAVWEWLDAAGQIHRSGPSRAITATTDSNDTALILRFRTLPISLKDNTIHYPLAQSISLVLYRLSDKVDDPSPEDPDAPPAPDGLFHRVFGGTLIGERPTDGAINEYLDPTTQTLGSYFFILDETPDARLVFHATAPDALQFGANGIDLIGPLAQTVPAFSATASWQNRIWGADALNPAVIWYSDEIVPDLGSASLAAPIFTGNQTFRVGEIGDITAMHAMNNYLIVFTASAIYAIGAQDAGGGQMAVNLEPLHEGIGCIEPRSVVLGPPGIFFQSAKGIHLLNRDRMLEFDVIGAQIIDEIVAAGNIRSASIDESDSKIKYVCNGRPVTSWVTIFTIDRDEAVAGNWSIDFGVGDPVVVPATISTTAAQIAAAFEAAIALRIGEGPLVDHDLREIIADVQSGGPALAIIWQPEVIPAYTLDQPFGGIFTPEDTSSLETKPRVLVFNYFTRTWSRADLQGTSTTPGLSRLSEAVDGCMWRGTAGANLHVVLTQNACLVERGPNDTDAFLDQNSQGDNVPVPIDIETSWLSFANVANWQRIRSIDIQGETPDDSPLFVDVITDITGDHAHPELDTYEWSTAPSSGRIRPRVQLCSAVKVRIYETEDEASLAENIAITALVFELGVHKGPRRQSDGQTGT